VCAGSLAPLLLQVRAQLHRQAGKHNVVIMSYEALRADIDWVSARQWGYVVLDEGHIIRNPKSQISQACTDRLLQTRGSRLVWTMSMLE